MKKALKVVLFAAVLASMAFTSCTKKDKASAEDLTINLWTFTDEVPGMVEKYIAAHPEFKYKVNTTIIATTDGAYQPALDQALMAGGKDQPDFFCAESAFVLKYTKGDMQDYAMPYKNLGINVDKACKDADIAKFTMEIANSLSFRSASKQNRTHTRSLSQANRLHIAFYVSHRVINRQTCRNRATR